MRIEEAQSVQKRFTLLAVTTKMSSRYPLPLPTSSTDPCCWSASSRYGRRSSHACACMCGAEMVALNPMRLLGQLNLTFLFYVLRSVIVSAISAGDVVGAVDALHGVGDALVRDEPVGHHAVHELASVSTASVQ